MRSERPFFSIIIPSYNSADYIQDTLCSLKSQLFQNFEIIVIDDDSTDETLSIAERLLQLYNLKGIALKRSPDLPKGVASCRNLGIKLAKGEWVCFLDSDDLFGPEKLTKIYAWIEEFGNECEAYHHGARHFEDGTNNTLNVGQATERTGGPRNIVPELIHKNFITTSTVVVKKNLAEKIGGFDVSLHGIEDYMMWLCVAKQTSWYYGMEQLTDYRVRKQSLMGGRKMRYYVVQNRRLLDAVKRKGDFTQQEVQAIGQYLFEDVMNFYASQAIKGRGWGDFLNGLTALAAAGKARTALGLLAKHFKFSMLGLAVRLVPDKKTKTV